MSVGISSDIIGLREKIVHSKQVFGRNFHCQFLGKFPLAFVAQIIIYEELLKNDYAIVIVHCTETVTSLLKFYKFQLFAGTREYLVNFSIVMIFPSIE